MTMYQSPVAPSSTNCFVRLPFLGVFLGTVCLAASQAWAQNDIPAPTPAAPPIENLVNVSWGDQIMIATGDAQLDTPDKVRRAMTAWRDGANGKTILWRGSSYSLDRYYEQRSNADSNFIRSYYSKVKEVRTQFDPLQLARKIARKNGQQFLIYLTVFDHGAPTSVLYGGDTPFPWQDQFTIENPQFQTVDRDGNYHYGVLEMAYPESRRLMVDRIKSFVEEFDTDGVYVCTRTHSLPALHADEFGFSPPVVAAFKERHGVDILEDPRFDYKSSEFDAQDALVEKWRRLRGEYVVQFYRELRAALGDTVIYTGIPRGRYAGPPYGNRYFDWESLVREQLVDGLVVGVYAGKGLHPPLYVPHDTIGYLSSEDDRINIPSREEAVDEVYGPLCQSKGVKLFVNTGGYGSRLKRWQARDPLLSGFMINTPAGASHVAIKHDDALSGSGASLTIEAFIYLDEAPGEDQWSRILSKYDHVESDRYRGWEWLVLPDGRFRFRANQASLADPGVGGEVGLDSPAAIPLKRWLHVATVYDRENGVLRLYWDGQEVAQRSITPLPIRINRDQEIYLGRYGGSDSHRFSGMIDELRIVGEAIDFTKRPKKPYQGSEANTVALYHFDDVNEDGRFVDSGPAARHTNRIVSGLDSMRPPSLPGFGLALRPTPTAE